MRAEFTANNAENLTQTAINSALKKQQEGQYKEALSIYDEALCINPDDINLLSQKAHALRKLQRYGAAIETYLCALKVKPNNAELLYNLANIYSLQGNLEKACSYYEKAIHFQPELYPAHFNLGNLEFKRNQLHSALSHYAKVTELAPNFSEAHHQLGNVYRALKEWENAIASQQTAIAIQPDFADAYFSLAQIQLEQGNLATAMQTLNSAIKLNPAELEWQALKGFLLSQQGRITQAEAILGTVHQLNPTLNGVAGALKGLSSRTANEEPTFTINTDKHNEPTLQHLLKEAEIAYQHHDYEKATMFFHQLSTHLPDNFQVLFKLGCAYQKLGNRIKALKHFRQALQLDAGHAATHANLAYSYLSLGEITQAIAHANQAIKLDDSCLDAYLSLGNAYFAEGRLEESQSAYRNVLRLAPKHHFAHSALLNCLNYDPTQTQEGLGNAHSRFDKLYRSINASENQEWPHAKNPQRKLHVAYLCPSQSNTFIKGFLEHNVTLHNAEQFEIFIYAYETTFLTELEHIHHVNLRQLSDEALKNAIQEESIDLIIDLAGQLPGNKAYLLANRLAPVQISYLGYPNTSGLTAMDYLIADDHIFKAKNPIGYTEKILTLPETFFTYMPPINLMALSGPPLQDKQHITFGHAPHLSALNKDTFSLWGRILTQLPQAKLSLLSPVFRDSISRNLLKQKIEQCGVAAEQLQLSAPQFMDEGKQQFYQSIDIFLGTTPYQSAEPICEALLSGVPVIILEKELYCSRIGCSILHNVQHPEFIAKNEKHYQQIALELAHDQTRLALLRKTLRKNLLSSSICQPQTLMTHLESLYREAWQRFCLES